MSVSLDICIKCRSCSFNANYEYFLCCKQYEKALEEKSKTINWDEYEQYGANLEEEILTPLSSENYLFAIFYADKEEYNDKFKFPEDCPSKLENMVLEPRVVKDVTPYIVCNVLSYYIDSSEFINKHLHPDDAEYFKTDKFKRKINYLNLIKDYYLNLI